MISRDPLASKFQAVGLRRYCAYVPKEVLIDNGGFECHGIIRGK